MWLLLVLMAFKAKRQRVERRGSEAAGDGDECRSAMRRLHELRSHVLRPVLEQNYQRVLPQQRLPQVHEAVARRACGPLPQAGGGIGGGGEDQDETALS